MASNGMLYARMAVFLLVALVGFLLPLRVARQEPEGAAKARGVAGGEADEAPAR